MNVCLLLPDPASYFICLLMSTASNEWVSTDLSNGRSTGITLSEEFGGGGPEMIITTEFEAPFVADTVTV